MVEAFPDVGGGVHDAVEARAVLDRSPRSVSTVPMAEVRDERVPAAAGGWIDPQLGGRAPAVDVPVRTYRPEPAAGSPGRARPTMVFVHGGGWVLGDLDRSDATCRRLAHALGAVVVSVDHRLAPEHPFPAGLRDVGAVLAWAVEAAAPLGADPGLLVVAGDSSGGNLAAAAALAARDGGPPLALQLLVEPALDARCDSPSYRETDLGGFLRAEHLHWFWARYLPEEADRTHPLASPLTAPDLTGAAPTIIAAAGHDPLRDEAAAYAGRLAEAGVPVGHRCYGDLFHGAFGLADALPEAAAAVDEVVGWASAVLAADPGDRAKVLREGPPAVPSPEPPAPERGRGSVPGTAEVDR